MSKHVSVRLAGREAERLRYGTSLKYLPEVWKNCLREESVIAVVIADAEPLSGGILVVAVSAFVFSAEMPGLLPGAADGDSGYERGKEKRRVVRA